jgi:hypothetical protein
MKNFITQSQSSKRQEVSDIPRKFLEMTCYGDSEVQSCQYFNSVHCPCNCNLYTARFQFKNGLERFTDRYGWDWQNITIEVRDAQNNLVTKVERAR